MAVPQRVSALDTLLEQVRACHVCAEALPLGPRPVFQVAASARILIASQAPGTKVHESGVPFADASGARLREWMGVSTGEFYDASRVAILPMGFCYPGRLARGGDAPPRKECAPLWRSRILDFLPDLQVTLLVGSYAQMYALGRGSMTERVRQFQSHLPRNFPLPHPSWRSRLWCAQNPWFESDVLPVLRSVVRSALARRG